MVCRVPKDNCPELQKYYLHIAFVLGGWRSSHGEATNYPDGTNCYSGSSAGQNSSSSQRAHFRRQTSRYVAFYVMFTLLLRLGYKQGDRFGKKKKSHVHQELINFLGGPVIYKVTIGCPEFRFRLGHSILSVHVSPVYKTSAFYTTLVAG